MKLDRTNQLLLATSVVLLFATGLRLWSDGRPAAPLFEIPPLQALHVRAIDVKQGDQHIRLERGERWALVEPRALPADEATIGEFLRDWGPGFRPDLRLPPSDQGLDTWGLDEARRTSLRIEDAEGARVELHLGAPTAGGGRYLQRVGEPGVYRGRVPGSHRLSLDVADWQDQRLFSFTKDDLAHLGLETVHGTFGFDRVETPERASWQAAQGTAFSPSSRTLDGIARSIADTELVEILEGADADARRPEALERAVARLRTESGRAWVLRVGPEAPRGHYAAIDGDPRLFVVPTGLVVQLETPPSQLRDRTVLRLTRSPDLRIRWTQGAHQVVVAPEGARGWRLLEPATAAAPDELSLAANSLVNLQAVEVLDDVTRPPASVTISDHAGAQVELAPDGDRWLAWDARRPETFVLRGAVMERLLRVFGAP